MTDTPDILKKIVQRKIEEVFDQAIRIDTDADGQPRVGLRLGR